VLRAWECPRRSASWCLTTLDADHIACRFVDKNPHAPQGTHLVAAPSRSAIHTRVTRWRSRRDPLERGLDSAFRLGFTDGHEHLAPPYEMDRGFENAPARIERAHAVLETTALSTELRELGVREAEPCRRPECSVPGVYSATNSATAAY
jgi:hypothetical protein